MKILVHDFCGHPFTLTLAVELKARGHDVHYVYFASETGPKADFKSAEKLQNAPALYGLEIVGQYKKDAFISRRNYDINYGRQIRKLIGDIKPDVLLSGNTPTEVQSYVIAGCKKAGTAFVYWMQDFYSIAAAKLLKKKLGILGAVIGAYYKFLDWRHLRASEQIVLITKDFEPIAAKWAGRNDNIETIENWGVLADIPRGSHDNKWSRSQKVHDKINFIYSGTLGLKHNPELLAKLAQNVVGRAEVFVISQGASVPYLQSRKSELALTNLHILPLQPFEMLPMILSSADVVVATIEPDAGTFSVPSKVLSYLCAGKPILLAADHENLAARIVANAGAGIVVAPDDDAAFITSALSLLNNPNRSEMGDRGRQYAEEQFDIAKIAARFEQSFAKAIAARKSK
jgi:colanic acid biosynthesis glycosyl transferase WcaI